MNKLLSGEEKRYLEKRVRNSDKFDPVMWPAWGGWFTFALGGFAIVSVCFLTASELSTDKVSAVLAPGLGVGMILLTGGYWTQHMSTKAKDDKVLAGILKKLLR